MSPVYLPVLLLSCGLLVLSVILGTRLLDALSWRRSLVAFQLHPPTTLAIGEVSAWLSGIQAMTHPTRFALLPLPPVCIEVISTSRGISYFIVVPKNAVPKMLAGVRASMPGCRISEAPDYLNTRPAWQVAAELTMTSRNRPLAVERAEHASTALVAALQPVPGTAEIRMQWIVTSAGTPRPVPTASATSDTSPAWSWDNAVPHDAEAVHAARAKIRDLLLLGVARVGVSAPTKAQAYQLFGRVWNNYHIMNAVGVQLRRRFLPSALIADRLRTRAYPLMKWPLLIGSQEAAGLVALPVSGITLPGLALGAARQLPPPPHMAQRGNIIGLSTYPGMTNRPVALKTDDRLRHAFMLGATGSGKSWLLGRMILQDIRSKHGMIGIDMKGDLLRDVLSRIDDKDAERVVVIDASERNHPIGLNVLGGAHDETGRELLVDNVLHVFRSIWADFWGPRSDSLCRTALTTLVHSRGIDGSTLTLCELVPLLTNTSFRRFVVNQPGLPGTIRAYWQRFDAMSDGERQQSIAPLLHKAEAFTSRTPIRLMLGQSSGFDLRDIFHHRKAVLISLAKGSLGTETANLLGALLVSLLWQATLSRVAVPPNQRRPAFAFIDEAADLMRLPIPLADMFSQARGLGLGVLAATQYLHQVPESIKAALLGTVRTQIVFAVEREDGLLLAPRFAPLTVEDLQGLARYEVALRPCLDGVTHFPVTLTTLPLDAPTRDADELAAISRARYGRSRSDVETALTTRIHATADNTTVGRRLRGGSA